MSPHSAAKRTSTLKQQAAAMREKVKALQLDEEDEGEEAKPKHALDILQKKLEKVEKLLSKETPGSKDYKKLSKKKEQYDKEMEEFQAQAAEKEQALAKAREEAEEAERLAKQAEEDERRALEAQRKKEEEE